MSPALSIAASLSLATRQKIGIQAVARTVPISHLANQHQVSRKFVYYQGDKAQQALDESFAPSQGDDVLFHLPVTKNWLYQLILGLVLICHSSYRNVVELFRDLFDTSISVGTVHNRLQETAEQAAEINQSQDLASIKVGLQDEIYQTNKPVLVGVDAASTCCYLLKRVNHRDEDTWGWHLLDMMGQGFDPDYTIADGGSGLRAGQKAAMPEVPCHGDVFHIQQQFEQVVNGLIRRVQGAETRLIKQAQQMANTSLKEIMAQKLLSGVLQLARPPLAVRQDLFDFIVSELQQREDERYPAIRKLRKALRNQRDQLLAFAGVIDQKLADIAGAFELPLQAVREVCLLHRKHRTSNAYWERWNQLHVRRAKLGFVS